MGGAARLFAGIGIALAGVLLFSLLAVMVAYDAAKPIVEHEYPTQIYQREDDCRGVPCFESLAEDTFWVRPGMNEVSFVVYAVLDMATGPARVTVVDPSGDVRYHRILTSEIPDGAFEGVTQDSATWSAEVGEWTLTRSYVGTSGKLTFDAWGFGLPSGTLG